jgi:hypothetical protein
MSYIRGDSAAQFETESMADFNKAPTFRSLLHDKNEQESHLHGNHKYALDPSEIIIKTPTTKEPEVTPEPEITPEPEQE